MLKNFSLFIIFLCISRFVGIPNFTPLIAFAIFIPKLTDNLSIQYLLPVSIVACTNLFLEPVNTLILATIIVIFLVTPAISKYSKNLFWASINALLVWHIFVNGAVWLVNGGPLIEVFISAIPFDLKLAISTGLYVLLFYIVEKFWSNFANSNLKILDS